MLVAKFGLDRVEQAGEPANGFPIWMIHTQHECKNVERWLADTFGENGEIPF